LYGLVEVGLGDRHVGHALDGPGEGGAERLRRLGRGVVGQFDDDLLGPVGRRHHVLADLLRQRLDERGDELFAQPRHLPVEPVGAQPREQGERDRDRDAVVIGAGLEAVRERERLVALLPGAGEAPFESLRERLL
jgi:hypothetical protein